MLSAHSRWLLVIPSTQLNSTQINSIYRLQIQGNRSFMLTTHQIMRFHQSFRWFMQSSSHELGQQLIAIIVPFNWCKYWINWWLKSHGFTAIYSTVFYWFYFHLKNFNNFDCNFNTIIYEVWTKIENNSTEILFRMNNQVSVEEYSWNVNICGFSIGKNFLKWAFNLANKNKKNFPSWDYPCKWATFFRGMQINRLQSM